MQKLENKIDAQSLQSEEEQSLSDH